jgi:hypothetical protein
MTCVVNPDELLVVGESMQPVMADSIESQQNHALVQKPR